MNNKIAKTKREDGIIISSIKVPCLDWYGKYETAAIFESGTILVFQGYDTIEDCIRGHNKYCNMSTEEIENFDFIG